MWHRVRQAAVGSVLLICEEFHVYLLFKTVYHRSSYICGLNPRETTLSWMGTLAHGQRESTRVRDTLDTIGFLWKSTRPGKRRREKFPTCQVHRVARLELACIIDSDDQHKVQNRFSSSARQFVPISKLLSHAQCPIGRPREDAHNLLRCANPL